MFQFQVKEVKKNNSEILFFFNLIEGSTFVLSTGKIPSVKLKKNRLYVAFQEDHQAFDRKLKCIMNKPGISRFDEL